MKEVAYEIFRSKYADLVGTPVSSTPRLCPVGFKVSKMHLNKVTQETNAIVSRQQTSYLGDPARNNPRVE